jgi:hypothetical protein
MRNEKDGQEGATDPKTANAVEERPGLPMMSEAGRKLAAHTAPLDAKKLAGEKSA